MWKPDVEKLKVDWMVKNQHLWETLKKTDTDKVTFFIQILRREGIYSSKTVRKDILASLERLIKKAAEVLKIKAFWS